MYCIYEGTKKKNYLQKFVCTPKKNMYHASEEIFNQYFKVLKFYKLIFNSYRCRALRFC